MPDFVTADDLYNFEVCPRIVYLDHHGSPRDRLAPSDYQRWLMEQGAAFEQQAIAEHDIYQVPDLPDSPASAFGLTLMLMQRGARLIYQGTLIYEHWQGRPDLLERVEGPSDLGDYHYRPVDIKSARQASKQHRHQVMFYSFLLGHVQGVAPERLGAEDHDHGAARPPIELIEDEEIAGGEGRGRRRRPRPLIWPPARAGPRRPPG